MKVVFVMLFLLLAYQSNSQDCLLLKGQWLNELGSALIIEDISQDGKIIGQYASSTGVDGKVFPLTGWMNRSEENPEEINIAFMVRWKGYGSITSWTGYCIEDQDGTRIKTIWNLVRSGKEHSWERIITNSSTFTLK